MSGTFADLKDEKRQKKGGDLSTAALD